MTPNEELQKRVVLYQNNPCDDTERTLMEDLEALATHVIEYFGKEPISPAGLAEICLEKVDRFNPERGKAFNFFTTVMMCQLRQACQSEKWKAAYRQRRKEALA